YYFDSHKWGIRNVRPMAIYYYIYPESRVNLENLAYHFDYSLPKGQPNPEGYILPVLIAIARWKKAFRTRTAAFEYESRDGTLVVRDSRSGSQKIFYLSGLARTL